MTHEIKFNPSNAYVNEMCECIRTTSEKHGVGRLQAAAMLRALSDDLMRHVGASIETLEVSPIESGDEQGRANDN